jgi:putative flippase GtrA
MIVQFARFGTVGIVGFVIDGGLLWMLMSEGFGPYSGRLFSFVPAAFVGWLLNRLWSFAAAPRTNPFRQFPRYLAVQTLGASANWLTYLLVIMLAGTGRVTALAALVAGSGAGMFLNFFGARRHVFGV